MYLFTADKSTAVLEGFYVQYADDVSANNTILYIHLFSYFFVMY